MYCAITEGQLYPLFTKVDVLGKKKWILETGIQRIFCVKYAMGSLMTTSGQDLGFMSLRRQRWQPL